MSELKELLDEALAAAARYKAERDHERAVVKNLTDEKKCILLNYEEAFRAMEARARTAEEDRQRFLEKLEAREAELAESQMGARVNASLLEAIAGAMDADGANPADLPAMVGKMAISLGEARGLPEAVVANDPGAVDSARAYLREVTSAGGDEE